MNKTSAYMPEEYARKGRQLWRLLAVLVLGGGCLLGYFAWSSYHEACTEADLRADAYGELVETRFDGLLRRIDADLTLLVERIPPELLLAPQDADAVAARQVFRQELEHYRQGFPEVGNFIIADLQGQIINAEMPVNVADRAHFSLARDSHRTVVSDVLRSRLDGHPVIVVARAIRDAQGAPVGVVMVPLQLDVVRQMFDAGRLGREGEIDIRRQETHRSLIYVAAEADGRSVAEASALPAPQVSEAVTGKASFLIQESPHDGKFRHYAYRRLERYPFYVLAGISSDEIRQIWLQHIAIAGSASLLLFVGLLLVLVGLFRAQQREAAALTGLRRNKEQLRRAQRIACLGSWEMDLDSLRISAADDLLEIFGIDAKIPDFDYADFLSMVHSEDRTMVDRLVFEAIARRTRLQIEHRLQLPDGRIKHVLETAEIHPGESVGQWVMLGTTQDVTDQHRIESKLLLLASAFMHSREAILITDRDNRIVTVNPAFSKLTGYAESEVMGRDPGMLSSGRTTREEYQVMWRAIAEQDFWQGELWDRRKDGGIYPKWVAISSIRDAQGQVCNYIAHFTDISAERAAEEQLQHLAHHDALTGLFNRVSLKMRLDQAIAQARRDNDRIALLFIDLDRFKIINDTLGHHIGDKLLIEVAKRLRDSVRESDIVARFGGDEFVVMLNGVEKTSAAAMVAEKLVRNIGDPYVIEGYDLFTTPSIGIAIYPDDGPDVDVLMRNADAAMYHAKAAGRNNFQFFDARMNDAALERLQLENSLRQALAREEFCVHYQPIIDVASGRISALEALVRWQHPSRGMVPPASFIGIAEETGLIQPIGEWVFWKACRQLADFNEAGFRGLKMTINISALQLRNGNLPVIARGAIEAFGFEPETLVFEITESVAMQHPEETANILEQLSNMGVGLAIDDFGTGYSSLSYLRMFPIDHLKLDRSFVKEIGEGPDSAVICDATIGLGHNLGLEIVAEGVETEGQFEYLRQKGCDFVQGYLFSRPVPYEAMLGLLQQRNP